MGKKITTETDTAAAMGAAKEMHTAESEAAEEKPAADGRLLRPQFDKLTAAEKTDLMKTMAAHYGLQFRELCTFSRWGQSCTTGVFEKDGREFVFVPGDTVTLGWEAFAVGMDADNQAELRDVMEKVCYSGSAEEFLRETMSPVRQAVIPPMLAGRLLEEIGWEPVSFEDPRLCAEHPEWLEDFRKYAGSGSAELNLVGCVKFQNRDGQWRAFLYNEMDYSQLKEQLNGQGLSLPTANEWAYLCGGGCRTLFPWGDGMDYSMHLYHLEKKRDTRPYDMEEPNFFGLSISYDPYKREVIGADSLTVCGDGGCGICGGSGPLLGFLSCSPHCRPEEQEDDVLDNDFHFFRPVIRVGQCPE